MKALIIDDTEYKIESLTGILAECAFISQVRVARSFQSGVHTVKDYRPDVVLLDMSLPTSERPSGELEGRTRIYGGREILAEMDFDELDARVIIVTQFDHFGEPPHSVTLETLLAQLQKSYPKLFVGGIYYSNVDTLWRHKLLTLLENIRQKKI